MIKLLQAPITAILFGGLSFLLTMFLLLSKPLQTSTTANHAEEEVTSEDSFWQRHNPEIDQLLQEVRRDKEELAKREAELRELATRLQAERAEINSVTQRVAQLQAEFDKNVIRIKEEEGPSLKRLAKLYTTMSPEAVLTLIKDMDDESVVKVFKTMRESEVAPFLDAMTREGETQAKRVATLTEALTRTIVEVKQKP